MAETQKAIYVSFVGTKRLRDLLADLNYWHAPLAPVAGKQSTIFSSQEVSGLKVHQGFMARAEGVPLEQFYRLAQARRKALVFCGVHPIDVAQENAMSV